MVSMAHKQHTRKHMLLLCPAHLRMMRPPPSRAVLQSPQGSDSCGCAAAALAIGTCQAPAEQQRLALAQTTLERYFWLTCGCAAAAAQPAAGMQDSLYMSQGV
jgi:hypothetical protein